VFIKVVLVVKKSLIVLILDQLMFNEKQIPLWLLRVGNMKNHTWIKKKEKP